MHDLNFQNQQALNEEALVERAVNTGIGRGVFLPCLANGGKERVRQDLEEGRKLGIQGTPAFIVGKIGRNREVNAVATLSGAQPFEKFASILEKALAGR
jgi:predicted DsbA family dithiol-disulfide isomerase